MKNYQRLHYGSYFKQSPDGDYIPCTREECFAKGDEPTAENQYHQRWYYSPDQCVAIRLPRNKQGDEAGKLNAADLKGIERVAERQTRCIGKGTTYCDQKCDRCDFRTSIGLELDRPQGTEASSLDESFELEDKSVDIEQIMEDKELLTLLVSALDMLTAEEHGLYKCLIAKTRKQDIAERFGITLDGVRYRETVLRKKLLSYKPLKGFWTNFKFPLRILHFAVH